MWEQRRRASGHPQVSLSEAELEKLKFTTKLTFCCRVTEYYQYYHDYKGFAFHPGWMTFPG